MEVLQIFAPAVTGSDQHRVAVGVEAIALSIAWR